MPKIITAHDRDGNSFEVPTSDLRFCPSTYAVIIQEGKILLIPQHGDGYGLPGGRIELGESIEEALKREVKEETGYDIEIGSLLDCQSAFFRTNTSKIYIQSILIFYSASITGGELSDGGFEEGEKSWMSKAEWIDIDKISSLKFYGSADIYGIIKNCIL